MDQIEIDDDAILMPPPAPRVPLRQVQPEPTCSSSILPPSDLANATSYANSDANATPNFNVLSSTAVMKSLSSRGMTMPLSGAGYFETSEIGEVEEYDGRSDMSLMAVSPDDFEKVDNASVGDGGDIDRGRINNALNYKRGKDSSFPNFQNDDGDRVNAAAETAMEQAPLFPSDSNPCQVVDGIDIRNQKITSFDSIRIPLNAVEMNNNNFEISAKNNDDNENEESDNNCSNEEIFYDARSGSPDTSNSDGVIGALMDISSSDDANNPSMEECSATTNAANKKRKRVSRKYGDPPVKASFQDIIGHGAAKLRLDEALLPLALPPDLAGAVLTGIRAAPASILLHGPPGCGKTKLAKAVAGEAQAAFLSVGPSDILSKFVGESEASIRGLFREAREKAKMMESKCAVIFFDEIDALGRSRVDEGSGSISQSSGDNSSRRVLAELLIQMTGLSNDIAEEDSDEDDSGSENGEEEECPRYCEESFVDDDDDDDEDGRQGDDRALSHSDESNTSSQVRPQTLSPRSISPELEVRKGDGSSELSTSPANTQQSKRPSSAKKRTKPRVIVVAATNRPEDCDSALLRRFAVRVLVGLPSRKDRKNILKRLLADVDHTITQSHLDDLALATEGWSGSDLESMAREAVMAPVRECLRRAAILKKKSTTVIQRSETDSSQAQDQQRANDSHQAAREALLNSFRNLRPVTSHDFEQGIAFFLGEQQSSVFGHFMKYSNENHYDSSSSSDGDE